MIMILSCCDIFLILVNHPLTSVIAFFWLTGKANDYPSWVDTFSNLSTSFLTFSLFALLVMNFDRYLATSYPFFHHTSVTKGKLLTLFGILIVVQVVLKSLSLNDFISHGLHIVVYLIIVAPPMVFINYKLFVIARKSRRRSGISPKIKKSFSFKNISSCLLAVACFLVLQIPLIIYTGLALDSKNTPMLPDKVKLALLWSKTSVTMNSTFNCLIFYWKNKILRTEGMKLLKGIKISRSQAER
jgi:hypothetical protein